MPLSPPIDFDPLVDYYAALGLTAKANEDDIKRSYRQLAKQYHPDATGGDESKATRFRAVQQAYDVLGDPKTKARYDELRTPRIDRPRGSYAWDEPGPSVGDLGALFEQFFGRGEQARGGPSREESRAKDHPVPDSTEREVQASDGTWLRALGNDVYSDVRIPFDRAILGTTTTVVTIDGEADVKIPAGTSSGRKLRLRSKGIDGGDHYVTVQIDVPGLDDARGSVEQLVQQLRKWGK